MTHSVRAMKPRINDLDERLMAMALSIGGRNLGNVWPNPAVGCVIVNPNCDKGEELTTIIGRGWTGIGGRPHAETFALREAGSAARGMSAYVTLEPCAHHGQTPPCADALIDAGVTRVVTAFEDPDVRVTGRGHQKLAKAGIEVVTGCLEMKARALNAGYIYRINLGRPQVMLKLAMSRDGFIAARVGKRTQITDEHANRIVHMMRARSDAILIGGGTAKIDDPELTCRLAGMDAFSPVRIVLSRAGEISPASRLVQTINKSPLWVFAHQNLPDRQRQNLLDIGAQVYCIPDSKPGQLCLKTLLCKLGMLGITRLMVEGGGKISTNMLAEDLVDECVIFRSSIDIGPEGLPLFPPKAQWPINDPSCFELISNHVGKNIYQNNYRRMGRGI